MDLLKSPVAVRIMVPVIRGFFFNVCSFIIILSQMGCGIHSFHGQDACGCCVGTIYPFFLTIMSSLDYISK